MTATGHERIARLRAKHKLGDDSRVGLMGFHLKASAADPANRDIVFMATTDDIDLSHEVVVPSGGDMAYYLKNRAIFVDHRYDFNYHVGTMRSISPYPSSKRHKGWMNRVHIFDGLKNPMAEDVLTVARSVGIGCSIGFEMVAGSSPIDTDPPLYRDAEWIIRQWKMIELSVTAMPCNVSARSMGATDPDEGKAAALDALVVKGRAKGGIALESAVALGMPYRKATAVTVPKKLKRLVFVEA